MSEDRDVEGDIVNIPIPSSKWVCDILRREACTYLAGAGVTLEPPVTSGAPKLQLQNVETKSWLHASSSTACSLVDGDVASNGAGFEWTLIAMPDPGTFALQNCYGHFLRAEVNDGGFLNVMTINRVDCSEKPEVQAWEIFRLAPNPSFPSALTILSAHGFYVGHHVGHLTNRTVVAGDGESWLPHIGF